MPGGIQERNDEGLYEKWDRKKDQEQSSEGIHFIESRTEEKASRKWRGSLYRIPNGGVAKAKEKWYRINRKRKAGPSDGSRPNVG